MRTASRMNGDRRGGGGTAGGATDDGPDGPSGVMVLQLATASTMPAAASTLASTDGGRGGFWNGMSVVLLGSHRVRIWRRGRGGLGAGGVGGDQRGGGPQDEQFA